MTPFYEELKNSRESLGLSIEQISFRTKISKGILNSIEVGDLNILPKTYLRLFLKAYALEVNLDPQVILQNFEEFINSSEQSQTPLPETASDIRPQEHHNNHNVDKKPNRNFAAIIIILLVLIFLIAILKQVMMERKEKSISAAFPDSVSSNTSLIDTLVDTQAVVPETDLQLTILTKDTCWIKIIVDHHDSFEAILPPHYKKEAIASEQFDVLVGRPASVNLILNGKDLGPVGVPAIPTRLIITKDGIVRRQSYTTH